MGKDAILGPWTPHIANVREREAFYAAHQDAKLTRFGAGMTILLRKWCTFAIKDWL
jgi:hypothetical protein